MVSAVPASTRKILQLAAPAVVAKEDVEFAVRTKSQHAAVVITAWWLLFVALVWRHRCAVVLKRPKHDQIVIESQTGAIPNKPIDPISKQRHLEYLVRVSGKHVRIKTASFVGEKRIGGQCSAPASPEKINPGI